MTRPHIGISACFFHADPTRPIFKGKTLLYLEQSMAHYVMSQGAMPVLVPTTASPLSTTDIVGELAGLLLHGGSDLSPVTYGEEALRPEWTGDRIRDRYELDLLRACMAQDKPVLGICRGHQLINAAMGGTLFQDIETQRPKSVVHRRWEVYDQNRHALRLVAGTPLHALYGGRALPVNSVHHQAVKDLGRDLVVEAEAEDGIIEAVRYQGDAWVLGVQWHPEFQQPNDGQLDREPLLRHFLDAVRHRER